MEESKDSGGGDFTVRYMLRTALRFSSRQQLPVQLVESEFPYSEGFHMDVPSLSWHYLPPRMERSLVTQWAMMYPPEVLEENPLFASGKDLWCLCMPGTLTTCAWRTISEKYPYFHADWAWKRIGFFRCNSGWNRWKEPDELIGFLFRETSFPGGVFLMTGTGIVPGTDFTLQSKDKVSIEIESIGTLTNFVA